MTWDLQSPGGHNIPDLSDRYNAICDVDIGALPRAPRCALALS
jgi:hypothetical protein